MIRILAYAALCVVCSVGLLSCGDTSGNPSVEGAASETSDTAANATSKPVTPAALTVGAHILHYLEGPEKNAMEMPSDVAVGADGTVYVADGVNHRIMVFGTDGRFRSAFGKKGNGNGELSTPLGIAVNADGKIYVADTGNGRIQTFAADGSFAATIPLDAPRAAKPTDVTDVALDPNGLTFYAVDNDNHRILTGPVDGKTGVTVWGEPGRGERQFRYPFLIDTTADGYVLVAEAINTRVQALNARGKFVSFIGEWGIRPGQLFRPKGVAAAGGRIFVTDSYLGRIQVFRLDGEFLGELAEQKGVPLKFLSPVGVAAGPDGRLYVVEMFENRVCVLDVEVK